MPCLSRFTEAERAFAKSSEAAAAGASGSGQGGQGGSGAGAGGAADDEASVAERLASTRDVLHSMFAYQRKEGGGGGGGGAASVYRDAFDKLAAWVDGSLDQYRVRGGAQ